MASLLPESFYDFALSWLQWRIRQRASVFGWIGIFFAQAIVMMAMLYLILCVIIGAPFNIVSGFFIVFAGLSAGLSGVIFSLLYGFAFLQIANLIFGFSFGVWPSSTSWWYEASSQWEAGSPIPISILVSFIMLPILWVVSSFFLHRIWVSALINLLKKMKLLVTPEKDPSVLRREAVHNEVLATENEAERLLAGGREGTDGLIVSESSNVFVEKPVKKDKYAEKPSEIYESLAVKSTDPKLGGLSESAEASKQLTDENGAVIDMDKAKASSSDLLPSSLGGGASSAPTPTPTPESVPATASADTGKQINLSHESKNKASMLLEGFREASLQDTQDQYIKRHKTNFESFSAEEIDYMMDVDPIYGAAIRDVCKSLVLTKPSLSEEFVAATDRTANFDFDGSDVLKRPTVDVSDDDDVISDEEAGSKSSESLDVLDKAPEAITTSRIVTEDEAENLETAIGASNSTNGRRFSSWVSSLSGKNDFKRKAGSFGESAMSVPDIADEPVFIERDVDAELGPRPARLKLLIEFRNSSDDPNKKADDALREYDEKRAALVLEIEEERKAFDKAKAENLNKQVSSQTKDEIKDDTDDGQTENSSLDEKVESAEQKASGDDIDNEASDNNVSDNDAPDKIVADSEVPEDKSDLEASDESIENQNPDEKLVSADSAEVDLAEKKLVSTNDGKTFEVDDQSSNAAKSENISDDVLSDSDLEQKDELPNIEGSVEDNVSKYITFDVSFSRQIFSVMNIPGSDAKKLEELNAIAENAGFSIQEMIRSNTFSEHLGEQPASAIRSNFQRLMSENDASEVTDMFLKISEIEAKTSSSLIKKEEIDSDLLDSFLKSVEEAKNYLLKLSGEFRISKSLQLQKIEDNVAALRVLSETNVEERKAVNAVDLEAAQRAIASLNPNKEDKDISEDNSESISVVPGASLLFEERRKRTISAMAKAAPKATQDDYISSGVIEEVSVQETSSKDDQSKDAEIFEPVGASQPINDSDDSYAIENSEIAELEVHSWDDPELGDLDVEMAEFSSEHEYGSSEYFDEEEVYQNLKRRRRIEFMKRKDWLKKKEEEEKAEQERIAKIQMDQADELDKIEQKQAASKAEQETRNALIRDLDAERETLSLLDKQLKERLIDFEAEKKELEVLRLDLEAKNSEAEQKLSEIKVREDNLDDKFVAFKAMDNIFGDISPDKLSMIEFVSRSFSLVINSNPVPEVFKTHKESHDNLLMSRVFQNRMKGASMLLNELLPVVEGVPERLMPRFAMLPILGATSFQAAKQLFHEMAYTLDVQDANFDEMLNKAKDTETKDFIRMVNTWVTTAKADLDTSRDWNESNRKDFEDAEKHRAFVLSGGPEKIDELQSQIFHLTKIIEQENIAIPPNEELANFKAKKLEASTANNIQKDEAEISVEMKGDLDEGQPEAETETEAVAQAASQSETQPVSQPETQAEVQSENQAESQPDIVQIETKKAVLNNSLSNFDDPSVVSKMLADLSDNDFYPSKIYPHAFIFNSHIVYIGVDNGERRFSLDEMRDTVLSSGSFKSLRIFTDLTGGDFDFVQRYVGKYLKGMHFSTDKISLEAIIDHFEKMKDKQGHKQGNEHA